MKRHSTSNFSLRTSHLPLTQRLAAKPMLKFGLLICLFFFALSARAQTNLAFAPLMAPSQPNPYASFLRVMGALALVIGIFLAGVWLFKNWQRLAVQRGRGPKLNILETRSLGGRHALYVVGYEQQRFLISSSPGGVNFLSHLPAAAENEPASGAGNPAAPNFTQALAQVLKGK
jgi:flagellar biogenesis protein FliO